MKYLLVGDIFQILYVEDGEGHTFRFNKNENKWIKDGYSLFVASTGFDESEPEGSPYRYGSGDYLQEIVEISKEEAEAFISQPIDEEEIKSMLKA